MNKFQNWGIEDRSAILRTSILSERVHNLIVHAMNDFIRKELCLDSLPKSIADEIASGVEYMIIQHLLKWLITKM